jgi:amino acid transporter
MSNTNTATLIHQPRRTLGFPSLFVVAVGVVSAQSCIVSTLQGAGTGGASFVLALLAGFILTLCYISSYCELALMMPKAGSISTYTAVASGHFLAIIAALAGYLSGLVFGIPAELLVVDHILDVAYPGVFKHVGISILALFTLLNILGIDIFATVQNILAYVMLAALFVTCTTGSFGTATIPSEVGLQALQTQGFGFLPLITLAIWAFLSIEFICTLSEETINPAKNLPRAMYAAALVVLTIHLLLTIAGIRQVPASDLAGSDVPHWLLVKQLFGESGRWIICIVTITTTSGVINSVLATIPRMLSGMARNGQLPAAFIRLHPRYNTPWIGTIFLAVLMGAPLLFVENSVGALTILVISSAAVWLFTYIIAHYNVIKLRKMYPAVARPYKSKWYPLPQIVGIVGMGYAIVVNSPSQNQLLAVYGNTAAFIGIAAAYALFWVKYKMKKKLFTPEPIQEALEA